MKHRCTASERMLAFVVALMCVSACKTATEVSSNTESASSTPQTMTQPTNLKSPIRQINFGKIAYPNFPEYENGHRRVNLKPGEAIPAFVDFGDVTGDAEEEALVVFPNPTRGTAILYYVYVFGWESNKLKLLWDFEAGDRGDGGVRRIYPDEGKLGVELYGKDKVVGRTYQDEQSVCCPKNFTRSRYVFREGRFHLTGEPEVLSNPSEEDTVLMTRYRSQQ